MSVPGSPVADVRCHEFRPAAVELLRYLPTARALVFALAVLLAIGAKFLLPTLAYEWQLIGVAVAVLGAIGLAARLLPASMVGIVVGSDGLLLRGHFIPYANIRDVHYTWTRRVVAVPTEAGQAEGTELSSRVTVETMDGTKLEVTRALTSELRSAIDDARAAWAARLDSPLPAEAALARAGRPPLAWLQVLRGLRQAEAGVYRAADFDVEQLSERLADSGAPSPVRAAAAVVLTATGEPTAVQKVRIAANVTANPRLRVALDCVAAAKDDAAIAEALEALEAAEPERAAPLLQGPRR